MSSVPSILYIGLNDAQVLLTRLAGVRRYAAARGLEVMAVADKGAKAAVEAFLSRRRPKGCVVECHAGKTNLEPSLFGSVPVVYLNSSLVTRHSSPVTRHPSLVTRHSSPVTRHS